MHWDKTQHKQEFFFSTGLNKLAQSPQMCYLFNHNRQRNDSDILT